MLFFIFLSKQSKMLKSNFSNYSLEAGTDEAGRGCLAGPVTAAAVILSPDFTSNLLNDSKQLTEKIRTQLRVILEEQALSFAVTHLDPIVIDKINILNASLKAMQECVIQLNPKPEYIIVDGNRPFIPKKGIQNHVSKQFTTIELDFLNNTPSTSIIKGDSKYLSIAAASILAKTYRDDYMNHIHEEFPMYNWKQNKGYPTQEHREAIKKFGITKYHRMSFKLLPEQLKLEI